MEKRVSIILVCVAICTLAMSTTNAQAQNLFEADTGSGNIYKFTPGGTQSTFVGGLNAPFGLAFDSAGNLFEADQAIHQFVVKEANPSILARNVWLDSNSEVRL